MSQEWINGSGLKFKVCKLMNDHVQQNSGNHKIIKQNEGILQHHSFVLSQFFIPHWAKVSLGILIGCVYVHIAHYKYPVKKMISSPSQVVGVSVTQLFIYHC